MKQNYHYCSSNAVRTKRRRRKKNQLKYFRLFFIFVIQITIMTATAATTVHALNHSAPPPQTELEMPVSGITPEKEALNKKEIGNKEKMDMKPLPETGYDYANPVPTTDTVGNEYFDDAVFIGDSRTEGLLLNTGLTNAIAYTHKGLMVDTVLTKPVINMNGDKISVMDALRQTAFTKVYIMFGVNETGWPYNDIFIEKYGKVIDEIKNINPDAIIYVQEILPVTESISRTHRYVKNEKINEFNKMIRGMAEEKHIYYVAAGSAVADGNGCLPEDAATDGIHLKKSYCEKWLEYLKSHTVTK